MSSKLPALFLCHLQPCLPTVRDFCSTGTMSQIDTSFDTLPWSWCFCMATEKYLGTTCNSTCPGGGLARVWESQNKWDWASPSLLFTSARLQPGLAFWLSSSQIQPPIAVQCHLLAVNADTKYAFLFSNSEDIDIRKPIWVTSKEMLPTQRCKISAVSWNQMTKNYLHFAYSKHSCPMLWYLRWISCM